MTRPAADSRTRPSLRLLASVVSCCFLAAGCTAGRTPAGLPTPSHSAGAVVLPSAGTFSAPGSSAAHPSTPAATPAQSPPATGSPSGLPSAARPCGWIGLPPHYQHVVWIWLENKDYASVIGNPSAPYENALANACGLATNAHGITHPSLPNYLAATGGSTFGVHDDAGPAAHPISGPSIFRQIDQAGKSWRAYEESMPYACATASSGEYAVKHNPAAYYVDERAECLHNDVPLDPQLAADASAGRLPSFAFVTPNLCHDMHDCSVAAGDRWLTETLPMLLNSATYRNGELVIVLTFDEGVGSANRIPTIVIAPTIQPGTRVSARLDHYSLLRGTEDLLGLPPLGAAAQAASLAAAFGL